MAPAPGTIDLGELPPAGSPERTPDRPRDRIRRWRADRHRLIAIATATLLVLGSAAGAAAPGRPVLTELFTVPAAGYSSDHRHLYVVERSGAGDPVLAAYRLADGAVQWRSPLPGRVQIWVGQFDAGTAPMVVSWPLTGTLLAARTAVFDPATGHRRWSRDGFPRAATADLVVLDIPAPGSAPEDVAPSGSALLAVDLVTGRPAWQAPIVARNNSIGTEDPRVLVTGTATGTLTTYDLDTGAELATAEVGIPRGSDQWGGGTEDLQVVGSVVLVRTLVDGRSTMAGLDPATLTRRWQVTEQVGFAGGAFPDWPGPCGSLICLDGSRPPRALDPDTGELVWSVDWLPAGAGGVWYSLSRPKHPQLSGHVVLSRGSDQAPGEEPDRWLVNAGTGEPVLDLRGWDLAVDSPASGPGANAPVPVVRRSDGGTVWVGWLRPDLSGVDPITKIDSAGECSARLPYLLCWDAQATGPALVEWDLTVWRLRH